MEYIYAQTPSKSEAPRPGTRTNGKAAPPRKKFDPYAGMIDLTLDSPPPRTRSSGSGSSSLRSSRRRDPDSETDESDDDVVVLSSQQSQSQSQSQSQASGGGAPKPGSAPTRGNNNNNPYAAFSAPLSSSSTHNQSHFHHRPSYNTNTNKPYPSSQSQPSRPAPTNSQPYDIEQSLGSGFGSSIAKPKAKSKSGLVPSSPASRGSYRSYIRPSIGFGSVQPQMDNSAFARAAPSGGYRADGWPAWADERSTAAKDGPIARGRDFVATGESSRRTSDDEEAGEDFDLGQAQFTSADFEVCTGDPDEQMRELLAEAVGDGEEGTEDGEETVEGFASTIKLMPHQVRGVRWMRERETGRRNGGILADDMGLGKTVQTLARIVDGRHTEAEKKTYKGGTLIICPLAVMQQWASEVRTKTKPGLLKVTTHHGPKRAKTAAELLKYDVVITTFQVVASEFGVKEGTAVKSVAAILADESDSSDDDSGKKKKKTKKKASTAAARSAPLFDIKWLRIVVDEAQNIKTHTTKTSKATVELKAKYRWCLTGTPIQNNVEELYSLFRFLRARPLDNWQTFRSRIVSEVKAGRTAIAMKRLQVILKAIMLRRTKNATIDGKPILNLPERNVEVVECDFDDDERTFYAALEQRTALTFNKYLKNGTVMSNYTSVLSMLLRLRQACDHPSLVTSALAESAEDTTGIEPDDDTDGLADLMSGLGVATERKCQICRAVLADQTQKANECPECSSLVVRGNKLPQTSTKIRKMLELLRGVQKRNGGKEKTIIFSQFTKFLDLLEPFLKAEGFGYVRYDGSLRNDQREKVLEAIKTSDEKKVILISFKAGSTGLNLTCCNNVILMDLWWNPALEDQAFDRAHRLGQTRDVNIYKLTIAETVEDRILSLQNQKRELADAALSGTALSNKKLTLQDMMRLFRSSEED